MFKTIKCLKGHLHEFMNFKRFTCSYVIRMDFYYKGRTQLQRQQILKNGAAYKKIRTHTFKVFYSQNYNTCEGS